MRHILLTLAAIVALPAQAEPLSDRQEAALSARVLALRTSDGATVGQVLAFAEKLRPSAFKAGEISSNYDSKRKFLGMSLCYFIGEKRLEGDQYCDVNFSVSPSTGSVAFGASNRPAGYSDMTKALQGGRDAWLVAVDEMYKENCLDAQSGRKTC